MISTAFLAAREGSLARDSLRERSQLQLVVMGSLVVRSRLASGHGDTRPCRRLRRDQPVLKRYMIECTVDLHVDLANGGAALEFASGTGRIALPLSQRGLRVPGAISGHNTQLPEFGDPPPDRAGQAAALPVIHVDAAADLVEQVGQARGGIDREGDSAPVR